MNSGTKRGTNFGEAADKAGTSRSPVGKQQLHHQQHNHRHHQPRASSNNSHSPTKKRREEEVTTKNNGIGTSAGRGDSGGKSPRRYHSHGGLDAALDEMRERKWATITAASVAGTSSATAKMPSSSSSTKATAAAGEKAQHRQYHHHHHRQDNKQTKTSAGRKGSAQRRLTFGGSHNKTAAAEAENDEENDDAAGPSAAADISSAAHARMLPLSKVRTIMEASPNASELKISDEAMFAMSKAAEAFVAMLTKGAYEQMLTGSHTRINYNELAMFVHETDELNFIQDILPQKHKFSEVEELMKTNRR